MTAATLTEIDHAWERRRASPTGGFLYSRAIAPVNLSDRELGRSDISGIAYNQSRQTIEISAGANVPEWLPGAIASLRRILSLSENWDGAGARRISSSVAIYALQLLAWVMAGDSTPPAIVPTIRGGIQLEWHRAGIDAEIEIGPDASVSLFLGDAAGNPVIETNSPSMRDIEEFLKRLRPAVRRG